MKGKIVVLAVLCGLALWAAEWGADMAFLDRPPALSFTHMVSSAELWEHLAALVLFLAFGLFAARLLGRNEGARAALRESEERFRSVFDNASIGIYRTEPGGRILMANPALVRMLGFRSFEELSRRNLEKEGFEPGYPRAEFKRRLEESGTIVGLETVWTRLDGTVLHVRESAHVLRGASGKVLCYEGTVEDMTESWRVQDSLLEAQAKILKAQSLAEVGALMQGLAHEIRNPLFAINVNAAALEKFLLDKEEARPTIGFIQEHVKRLDSLMRDLMELGRPLTPDEFLVCDLENLIYEACALVEEDHPESRVRIVVVRPDGEVPLYAVPPKIVQAFRHLLVNALQYSGKESKVTISVFPGPSDVVVEVMDRGEGLPESLKDRLFDPFVTSKKSHSGLGLALVRHYLEAHGGDVAGQNNEPGPGATFSVRIPLGVTP